MASEKENKVREQAMGQSKQKAQQVQRPWEGGRCFHKNALKKQYPDWFHLNQP